jgi:N-acyl-D-amino-acid deacylase
MLSASASSRTLLANGRLVDGTGTPARCTDVLVEGERVLRIGDPGTLPQKGATRVELGGLIIAPGFIDIHTHLDAQVTWDSSLAPSCWHGVTTVVMGNCGFGVAPIRPQDRETIALTLESVEGMNYDALLNGMNWDFESFPEYLASIAARDKCLNVAALLGHTPLRLYCMGEAAFERTARPDETRMMCAIAQEAMATGAFGFATSKGPAHLAAKGRPVPSRHADMEELEALAIATARGGGSILQLNMGPGLDVTDAVRLYRLTELPITMTPLLATLSGRSSVFEMLDTAEQAAGGVRMQMACRPITMQFTLADPYPFGKVSGFDTLLASPKHKWPAIYGDPGWRAQIKGALSDAWRHRWGQMQVSESDVHRGLVNGPTVAEIAEQRCMHPFDLVVEIALSEELHTRFTAVLSNDDEEGIALLLRDERTLLGLSDAGAHASQLCDACYSTYLLGYWVRERRAISLEDAVWRLTGDIAHFLGLRDRGIIKVGAVADIVAFNADTVRPEPLRRVRDLPGGHDRLIAESVGIEHVWVAGTQIRRGGAPIKNVFPGRLLRPSRRSSLATLA